MAVDDCNLMTEAEYKRAREYISNRYKVSLPYERPEPKIKP